MAERPQNRPLKYYDVPSQAEPHNNIVSSAINRNDFELKTLLLSIVQQNQFLDSPTDDPNLHLSVFVQYADTVKANGGGECAAVEKSTLKGGMYEVNGIDRVNAKVYALTQKIESLTITPATTVAIITPNCELCGTLGHINVDCQLLVGVPTDQINYAQGNPYLNTYNHVWRNHPNFSYKSNNALFPPNPTPAIPPGYQKGTQLLHKHLESQFWRS
ncbi:uncharacterized protein LOC127131291 [Lathyrus oleraceus]|uniref:uncharacterized protein LOC127131291 n=1 Tax=Pisum sativum TaxID=3888 RepID=UPI0021CFFE30|nr:uncharacterized protein LOC127131291 [Pisum sativum]